MQTTPKEKIMTVLRLAFVLGLLLAFLLGLGRTLLRPEEINYYENRPAERLAPLTAAGFLDGSFQDSMELALADQVRGALRLKASYNDMNSSLLLAALHWQMPKHPELFYRINGVYIHGDRVLWDPFDPEPLMPQIRATADGFNRVMAENPGLDFYLFFVETDAVLDFRTGERTPFYELICSLLTLPEEHCSRFALRDYEQFCRQFYRTDHHWNHIGSYQGYTEILQLLGCQDPPLEPLEERTLPEPICGSKALQAGLTELTEPFTAYRFAYPPLGTEYGHEEAFFAGKAELPLSYGNFYGKDNGLLVFDTGRETRPNLLIIGDSYDNAVLKLLASHYGRTFSVDLRNYEQEQGETLHLGQFCRENDVDQVLIVASQVVFCGDYILED